MSQFSVPWVPKADREYRGLAGLVAGLAKLVYAILAPPVKKFPGVLFLIGLVGAVLLAWAFALLFTFVDEGLIDVSTNEITQLTTFGGTLTIAEISAGLDAYDIGCPPARYLLWPFQFALVRDLIAIVAILSFVNIVPVFVIWWERKVAGHIQGRVGPMRVGCWHGWLQSPADGLKLLIKEDLVPANADRPLYRMAAYMAFVPAVLAFMALPFGTYWVFRETDVALLFVLAMLGLEVFGVLVAGWASNSKWAIYGGMREACQIISYEIPLGLSLLLPIMCVGTLSLAAIGDAQSGGWHTWLAFRNPWMFLAFGCFFIASLASCKRLPFDMAESESELVAGFHTEYSGYRWCLFFFAEYAAMFVVGGLASIMFLGGWYSPLPVSWGDALGDSIWAQAAKGVLFSGPLWFIFKATFLVFVHLWLRWTLPRLRIDQVLYSCVQVLLPLTLLALLGNVIWLLFVTPGGWFAQVDMVISIILSIIGGIFAVGFIVIALYGWWHRRKLVGRLAVDLLPGS